ncbi:DNA-directed RNA polymerase subunit delta [Lentibacillus persicus]|uniref:DNA-directed RNA polymerase subunit delta n=1 Tax=Lentibacillus persicus TaxID=640948 RepID=UPI000B7E62FE|nr:DNA-directed RNA polymerase subunit delta [Lentibacillus persicus]
MSLKEYSREELEVRSMLELANEYLLEEQQAQDFNSLFEKVADLKGFNEEQKQEYIAQFYTDLTIDGRFLTVSSGIWGLKRWYPVEQMDEIVHQTPKKTKKKAKKKKTEDVSHDEFGEAPLDDPEANVEGIADTFDDEILDKTEELGGDIGFDDELDPSDEDDDFEEEEEETKDEEK